jgi:hypothetical protein
MNHNQALKIEKVKNKIFFDEKKIYTEPKTEFMQ